MDIDMATVLKVSALLYLLMSLITWLLLGRPRRGSVFLWCLGGTLVGVSVWLINLRGQIPDVWTYGVAQTLFLGALLVLAQSVRMDLQRPWRWRWLLTILLVFAVLVVGGFDDPHSQGLAVLVRLANLAALLVLTLSALMLARQTRSRNAWFMTLGYGLMTAIMALVAVATVNGQANLTDLRVSVFNQLLLGVLVLTMVMSNMGYLGLVLEQSLRHNLELRQQQWQAHQWHERSQALALGDRQHALDMLANSLGHGILQPLTSTLLNVQMASRMLQSGVVDQTLMPHLLSQVVEGLHRSAVMVERIRSFLRPAQSRPVLLRLQSVVQDAESLLRQEMMYQGVAFSVKLPDDDVMVMADALPLTQALVQVLRNALKAVQEQDQDSKTIAITLQVTGHEAQIDVLDSGPGFPLGLLMRETDGEWTVSSQVEGLGLYMTRGLLNQLHGRLLLSNPVSGGARVCLILPRAEDA